VVLVGGAAGAQLSTVEVTAAHRQVTLTWTSLAPGLTEVAWGPTPLASFGSYANRMASNAATTTHSATVRRLPPGTWYLRARTGPFESPNLQVMVPAGEGFPLADWAFDDQVNAVLRVGASWYVGGEFTSVGPTTGGLVAVNFDGGLPEHFPAVAGQVLAVEPDGAGGLYLGGLFSSVGGLPRANLAHLLPDLGVDRAFEPSCNGAVYALHHEPGGTLYLAGAFNQVNGQPRTGLAAVSQSGALLGWGLPVLGAALALERVGEVVYVGGRIIQVGGQPRDCLAAIGVDGGLQPWNPGAGAG
jgi:hypothetical protein